MSGRRGGGGGRPNRQSRRSRPDRGGRGGGGRRRRRSSGGRGGHRHRRSRSPPPPAPPPGQPGRGCHRSLVTVGAEVRVVRKEDQRTGRETAGTVSRLLTNSAYHPRGIKVMLDSGEVGRVTRLVAGGADDGSAAGDGGVARRPPAALGCDGSSSSSSSSEEEERWSPDDASPPPIGDDIGNIDDGALAALVGVGFESERAREALRMFDNDPGRAANYLLRGQHG